MQGLLQLVEAERRSDTVNRLLLQHLLRMLTALGIYEGRLSGAYGAAPILYKNLVPDFKLANPCCCSTHLPCGMRTNITSSCDLHTTCLLSTRRVLRSCCWCWYDVMRHESGIDYMMAPRRRVASVGRFPAADDGVLRLGGHAAHAGDRRCRVSHPLRGDSSGPQHHIRRRRATTAQQHSERAQLLSSIRLKSSKGLLASQHCERTVTGILTGIMFNNESAQHAAAPTSHKPSVLQRRLNEEYERCVMYLDTATRKPLVAVLEQQLLARHVAAILEKGFDALVSLCRQHHQFQRTASRLSIKYG